MDTSEIMVIVGGVGLIALTLWYFFGEREKAAAATNSSGVQEIDGSKPFLLPVGRRSHRSSCQWLW